TANFITQYLLTGTVSPAGAGTIVASPASADRYYSSGTSVQLTATPNTGYVFGNWSGDSSGTTNPRSVMMDAPRAVTANFIALTNVTVDTVPAGLGIVVDDSVYTAPRVFQWIPGSSHTIAALSPQAAGMTSRYAFANWSDHGAAS